MAFNAVGNYNGSFIGNSSAKPICGKFLSDFYTLAIQQAILNVDTLVVPGTPVNIKNKSTGSSSSAGYGLNPNVLAIDSVASTNDAFEGFVLSSETDVLLEGDKAAHPVKGQIVNVAVLGSRIELYVPCDASVADKDINTALYWDVTNGQLTTAADGNVLLDITMLSPVVDGVKFVANNGSCEYANTKCVKVRI